MSWANRRIATSETPGITSTGKDRRATNRRVATGTERLSFSGEWHRPIPIGRLKRFSFSLAPAQRVQMGKANRAISSPELIVWTSEVTSHVQPFCRDHGQRFHGRRSGGRGEKR